MAVDLSQCKHWWNGPNGDSSAVLDRAPSGINMTCVAGASFTSDNPGGVTRDVLVLAGGTQYAQNASQVRLGTGDVSIFAFLKGTTTGKVMLAQGGANPHRGFYLYGLSTTQLYLELVKDGSNRDYYTMTAADWDDGAWHSFGFTKSGTTVVCYYDGSVKTATKGSAGTFDGNIDQDTEPFFLGNYHDAGVIWTGRIGPVGTWQKILGADDFAALHAGAVPSWGQPANYYAQQ